MSKTIFAFGSAGLFAGLIVFAILFVGEKFEMGQIQGTADGPQYKSFMHKN